MYENKKILVLGAAKSGMAVTKLLLGKNNDITVSDMKPLKEADERFLKENNIKIVITNKQEDLVNAPWDLIIKNPAIMSTSKVMQAINEKNIRVENEMEVAYHFLPEDVKIIGVTGSNGKTTTTKIIYELLKASGFNPVLGGNIGYPLAEILPNIKKGGILLLEISDHQLCDLHDFKTHISVLTNICPTHLDYHGTYEAYKKTKSKIFQNQTASDYAIINMENADALEESQNAVSQKLFFSSKGSLNANAYLKDDEIYVNGQKVININDIRLKGIHNYENILAAYLVLSLFTSDFSKTHKFLENFCGVEHRIEYVKTINSVKYYNDSKSTNPTSTITALKTFSENINLILGGLNRNQDFHELDDYMQNVVAIYAIGETTDKVMEYAKSIGKKAYRCETLHNAMDKIVSNALPSEVVLLSPGSSSQDQYARFEDRGDEFKKYLENFS